jgi:glycosyltransferase involved in cell wall biosynthesis
MKLRILHITPDFNYVDGRSYYVSLLLKYLKKRGHFVHLVTNGGDSLERANNDLSIIPAMSSRYSFVSSVKRLTALVKQHKIDIVHSHHRYYELLANSLPGKDHKTVSTALSIVDRRYFVDYKSDKIIAVSNAVKEMLLNKFGVKERRIEIIPNFVDTEEIKHDNQSPAEPSHKKNTFTILSAGRFHAEKDRMTLLKAMAILNNQNIKLILIGDGEEENSLRKFSDAKKINVEFIPPQTHLEKYFKAADMCILTSVRDPLPSFMLQCGLHGKPFAGTNIDGIAEVITSGTNGILFPEKDENSVAETVSYLMTHPEDSNTMAGNLHKLIMRDYTEKAVIPKIEKLYNSLLS